MRRLATVGLAAGIIALAACAPTKAAAPAPPRVVVWGDSFGELVARHLPADYEVRAFGGTAPCDWLPDIRGMAASSPIAVGVLLFVGNTHTACTGGTTLGYELDAARATALLRSAGSRVVIVAAPPFKGGPSPNPVNDAYGRSGAEVAWGPSEAVAPGGAYTQAYREADGVHLNAVGAARFAAAIRQAVG